jgi:hypothetical protein
MRSLAQVKRGMGLIEVAMVRISVSRRLAPAWLARCEP